MPRGYNRRTRTQDASGETLTTFSWYNGGGATGRIDLPDNDVAYSSRTIVGGGPVTVALPRSVLPPTVYTQYDTGERYRAVFDSDGSFDHYERRTPLRQGRDIQCGITPLAFGCNDYLSSRPSVERNTLGGSFFETSVPPDSGGYDSRANVAVGSVTRGAANVVGDATSGIGGSLGRGVASFGRNASIFGAGAGLGALAIAGIGLGAVILLAKR